MAGRHVPQELAGVVLAKDRRISLQTQFPPPVPNIHRRSLGAPLLELTTGNGLPGETQSNIELAPDGQPMCHPRSANGPAGGDFRDGSI
jgi:hypothetical protein